MKSRAPFPRIAAGVAEMSKMQPGMVVPSAVVSRVRNHGGIKTSG
jgi:hypothetical protein